MSKRKNRDRSPNIPQDTLERVRRQLEGADVDVPVADSAPSPAASAPVEVVAARPEARPVTARPEPSARPVNRSREERRAEQGVSSRAGSARRSSRAANSETSRPRRRERELTLAEIEEILAHPTKTVTEAELHAQYGYVLADLRNMGVLAAALFVLLVVLAQIL